MNGVPHRVPGTNQRTSRNIKVFLAISSGDIKVEKKIVFKQCVDVGFI
jgi:hypothetical protein